VLHGFESSQCVEQLQTRFVQRVTSWAELLSVLDCEPQAVDCDAGLVRQLKFKRRRPTMGLDHI
jgi:hypothetical protein